MRKLFNLLLKNRIRRSLALVLAVVVTFTTAYAMVLPAITLEQEQAETMAGVDLGRGDRETSLEDDSGEAPAAESADDAPEESGTMAFDAQTEETVDGETCTMQVHAEADTGTFPEGTTMSVTSVTDETVLDTIGQAVEGEVSGVHAVEITFEDTDGGKVRPQEGNTVQVTLASDAVPAGDETAVVQYMEEGEDAEEIPVQEDPELQAEPALPMDPESAVTFEAELETEEPAVYALVTTVPEETDPSETEMAAETADAEGFAGGEQEDPAESQPDSIRQENSDPEVQTAEEETLQLPEAVCEAVNEAVDALMEMTLEESILASDGHTYQIAVICGADAGISEGAELEVYEIRDATVAYDKYVEDTAETLGVEAESISFARFFDISIVQDGEKIQPQESVKVRIELTDELTREQEVKAVHFADTDETEVLEAEISAARDEAMESAITFDASGFSVYGIVTLESLDELDGQTYGIVNNQNTVSGTAVTSSAYSDGNQLLGKVMTVRVEPVKRTENVFVAKDSEITMWTFNAISGEQGYYISTVVDGALKYLSISGSAVKLVDEIDATCKILVTPGTGNYTGKYKLSSSSGAMSLSSGRFKAVGRTTNNASVWMNFAELSDLNEEDFVTYTATKVSVSGTVGDDGVMDYDVENGDAVIIYTRFWNNDTLRYDYYAIDYDGMLIKAYESGDTISWVGSRVNTMLWDFTEYYYEGTTTPNYYYELQNQYSGKYIAPQVSGDSVLSDNTIGINLNGRRNGEYTTTILAWDDPYYDYASLKILNGELISAPLAKADVFYFAKMTVSEPGEAELTQVATIDSKPFGITLRMQDYGNITSSNRSQEQLDVLGNTPYNQWTGSPGLLYKNLVGDYPQVKGTQRSLGELYSNAMEVNQQFLLSTYNETGYFEFDSTQNFAHLITSEDDYWYGRESPSGGTYGIGDFVIYDQIATTSEGGKETLKHGQFFPYNDLMVKNSQGEWVPLPYSTQYVNETDIHAQQLSSLDPRKGEKLFSIPYQMRKTAPDYADHFFGLEMSARFMQNESGVDAWGHDLIFEFSGDDDFWLYIDDKLVMDLGGIHSALDGSINFRTGRVVVNGRETNLRTLYKEAYMEENPEADEETVNEWLNTIFADEGSNSGTVFKAFTGHSMRMFFMERGAGASNLHMRFNLAPYTEGEVLLEKEVSGVETVDPGMVFPFQVEYKPTPNSGFSLLGDPSKVTDSQTGERIPYRASYTVDGLTYRDVFLLAPGQTASIRLGDEDTEYAVRECGVNTNVYDQVTANSSVITGIETATENLRDYHIEASTVANRKKVIFNNHVSDAAQKTLTITKKLWQDDGMEHAITAAEDGTGFRFRIYIGQSGGDYAVYNTGKYYVKDPDGNYCIYQNGGFVSTGKQNFSDLSTVVPAGEWKSEQEKATFYTSPGGAADKIRAGYSVEIPELMEGTMFLVEEWDDEIPDGYKLIGYNHEVGEEVGATANRGVIDGDKTVLINNQHGYGLTLRKAWSDAPFMTDHDEIYFAVYLKNADDSLELLPGSLRQLGRTDTSVRWFFPRLEPDKTLNDYVAYEVILTVPEGGSISVDPETGEVTGYSGITRINDGDTLTVGGTTNEHGYATNFDYTAEYTRSFLTDEQIADGANARTDVVSNARPGIKLVKTDLSGNPLEGAVFTLMKGTDTSTKKIFISDENGLIAVAYLEAGATYTLQETAAPYRHLSLVDSVTIRVEADNTVYVNDSSTADEDSPYSIEQVAEPTAANMPTVTIKNRIFSLQAVKVDATDESRTISGVEFALYSEVTDYYTGNPMPDYTPRAGFETLETDENGVIPRINLDDLSPGTYYLREKGTPSAYMALGYDVRLIIAPTGQISAQKAEYSAAEQKWVFSEDDNIEAIQDAVGNVTVYIRNTPKKNVQILKKSYNDNAVMEGVEFELYKATQVENGQPKADERPVVSGFTDENGILTLGALEENISYYLFETQTLDGYHLLSAPVVITTTTSGTITATMDGTPLTDIENMQVGDMEVWQITVYNSSGYELPSTGGIGTAAFTLSGILLTLGAGATLVIRRKK